MARQVPIDKPLTKRERATLLRLLSFAARTKSRADIAGIMSNPRYATFLAQLMYEPAKKKSSR